MATYNRGLYTKPQQQLDQLPYKQTPPVLPINTIGPQVRPLDGRGLAAPGVGARPGQMEYVTTGGPTPPATVPTSAPPVSNPYPPATVPTAPPVSTPYPPATTPIIPTSTPMPGATPGTLTGTPGVPPGTVGAPGTPANPNPQAPISVVQDMLNQFTDPQSAYMQQVANRAAQEANGRGALNSSIAAGSAQAAAIQAAQPFVAQAMGLQGQREQNAFQGGENALQRAFQKQQIFDQAGLDNWLAENNVTRQDWLNASDAQRADMLAGNQAKREDWLNSQQWSRDFNGALSLMPIQQTSQMLQAIMQAGLANPQVFTPDIMSGMGSFFSQNWMAIMQSMFPGAFGSGTGTIPTTAPPATPPQPAVPAPANPLTTGGSTP